MEVISEGGASHVERGLNNLLRCRMNPFKVLCFEMTNGASRMDLGTKQDLVCIDIPQPCGDRLIQKKSLGLKPLMSFGLVSEPGNCEVLAQWFGAQPGYGFLACPFFFDPAEFQSAETSDISKVQTCIWEVELCMRVRCDWCIVWFEKKLTRHAKVNDELEVRCEVKN